MRQVFSVAADNDHLGNAEPLPAIWPKYPGHVVRMGQGNERELVSLSWGFRTTNKSKKTGRILQPAAWNNARDDKVATSGLWKASFKQRRCLVPATSFCEAKGRNPTVYHWFGVAGDDARPVFAFAGMWTTSRYEGPDGADELDTYTMITTTPNELVKSVHPDRMPVILRPEDYELWLLGGTDQAQRLLRPFPADDMRMVKTGKDEKSDSVN